MQREETRLTKPARKILFLFRVQFTRKYDANDGRKASPQVGRFFIRRVNRRQPTQKAWHAAVITFVAFNMHSTCGRSTAALGR